MSEIRKHTAAPTSPRKLVRRVGLLVLVGLVVSLSAVMWGLSGTASDAACLGCHDSAGTEAGHAGIGCYGCHADRSVDGFLVAKMGEPGMLVAALSGADTTGTAATPPARACLRCHEDVLMRTLESGGVRIDHGTCAGSPQACTDCHWGAVHGSTPRPGRGVAMDRCLECHDDIAASWDCETCHTDSEHADRPFVGSWAVTHGPQWRSAHGMGDTGTCGACHPQSQCAKCHDVALPHPGGYVNGKHGQEARPNVDACVSCHGQAFCDDCHGVAMPHAPSFLPQHSSLVRDSGDAVCERCHVLDDCNLCHVGHVHPGIPEG